MNKSKIVWEIGTENGKEFTTASYLLDSGKTLICSSFDATKEQIEETMQRKYADTPQ